MDSMSLEVRELITARYNDIDEDGRSYSFYEVIDYDVMDQIELLTDEEGNFDYNDILDMLQLFGYITGSHDYIESDKYGLAFTVYSGNHKPEYEVVIV